MGEDWDLWLLKEIKAVSQQNTQSRVCSSYQILIKEYHFESWILDTLSRKIIRSQFFNRGEKILMLISSKYNLFLS